MADENLVGKVSAWVQGHLYLVVTVLGAIGVIVLIYVLTKEEGGRHTPFFPNYKPQFYFRTTDVTGAVLSLMSEDGKPAEMCMPGDNIKVEVEIISPIAMDEGLRFAIREGGRTVGAGVVTKVIA